MVQQVEEAAFFMLPPFLVKRGLLEMGKSGSEVHPQGSRCIAAIGKADKESTNSNLFVFPIGREAIDLTYHSNDKST
jgi:hypothetical protein